MKRNAESALALIRNLLDLESLATGKFVLMKRAVNIRELKRIGQALSKLEGITRLGPGLSIDKEIVDAHHGRIVMETAEGGGSRFTITLPHS